jgi:Uma2 family endonuclease
LPAPEELPRFSRVVPDLAVEVVSPNDEPGEVADKVAFFLAHGVPLVWVAYLATRQVAVHRPGQEPRVLGVGDALEGEEVVAGFRLPVADIFR